jgi:hypothetical protein
VCHAVSAAAWRPTTMHVEPSHVQRSPVGRIWQACHGAADA